MENITKDPAYNAVDPNDFPAMLDVNRYGERSTAFDKIISATHDHFWDPLDAKYIDFKKPFDMEKDYLINPTANADLKTAIADKLDEKGKIKLVNLDTWWALSSILHGEQGALALSASLCHILRDPGAQEYAANQTREEARHVTAFSAYIKSRWGKPKQVGPALGNLLNELVSSPLVWKKIIGMQMLVEGLAMGAFATFFKETHDPLMKQLMQLVMTDEAFHHKFGKIWADRTIPKLTRKEHDIVEDWTAKCFQTLLFNLINPEQMQFVYHSVGIDWREATAAIADSFGNERLRKLTDRSPGLLRALLLSDPYRRVLVKTLLDAGIITDRTKRFYAMCADLNALRSEGSRMVGDDIAEEGIKFLHTINTGGSVLAAE